MITSFDTDDIIFKTLSDSAELKKAISGGIYPEVLRPDNSQKEDICINTISITHETIPQQCTSNVNIYVPDLKLLRNGIEQQKCNRERLRTLSDLVIKILENAVVTGLIFRIASQTILREQSINQHYTNLRIEWVIAVV